MTPRSITRFVPVMAVWAAIGIAYGGLETTRFRLALDHWRIVR